MLHAFRNTLKVGISATIVATIIGTLAAFALTRFRFRGRSAYSTLVFVSRAQQVDIQDLKQRMGWEPIPWYTLNDDFEKNFRGVNFKGAMDDTEGSKKATVWKGYGEFTTDQFCTNLSYAVGEPLYCTNKGHALGAGLFTNEAAGTTNTRYIVGVVTGVPTASDPFLALQWLGVAGTVSA